MKKLLLGALLLSASVAFAGTVNCDLFTDNHNHDWQGTATYHGQDHTIYISTHKHHPNTLYFRLDDEHNSYAWSQVSCTEQGDEDDLTGSNDMRGTMYKQDGEINLTDRHLKVQHAYNKD